MKIDEIHREKIVIRVDRSASLEELIANGGYDWVHNAFHDLQLIEHEVERSYTRTVYLISMNNTVTSLEAEHWIVSSSLRSIDLRELLTIGSMYKEKQRSYAILATGASVVIDGVELVPYLAGGNRQRSLGLNWVSDGWGEFARFGATDRT